MNRCDFCANQEAAPRWLLHCRRPTQEEINSVGPPQTRDITSAMLATDWAACIDCFVLIQSGDPEGLIERWEMTWVESRHEVPHPQVTEWVRALQSVILRSVETIVPFDDPIGMIRVTPTKKGRWRTEVGYRAIVVEVVSDEFAHALERGITIARGPRR